MDPIAEPSELAVETLLADLALARLGTLLRSTRQERFSTRREVASRVGITARELRRYENGAAPVPRGVVSALAEFYGDHLDTHFSRQGATPIGTARVDDAIEDPRAHLREADEVLGAYVAILEQLPEPAADEPVSLRAEDLTVLSTALAVEPQHMKGRIAELVGRTTRLRRHDQLRRRKRMLSGAGIGIALATGAGFGVGALVGAIHVPAATVTSPGAPAPTTVAAPSTTAPTTAATAATSPTRIAAAPIVEVTTTAEPTTEPETTTTTTAIGTATTLISPPTTTTVPRPRISPDTTPMSIPGTEPVTIITGP
jgi:transcriptional regulator with XRE-family HTH domain